MLLVLKIYESLNLSQPSFNNVLEIGNSLSFFSFFCSSCLSIIQNWKCDNVKFFNPIGQKRLVNYYLYFYQICYSNNVTDETHFFLYLFFCVCVTSKCIEGVSSVICIVMDFSGFSVMGQAPFLRPFLEINAKSQVLPYSCNFSKWPRLSRDSIHMSGTWVQLQKKVIIYTEQA